MKKMKTECIRIADQLASTIEGEGWYAGMFFDLTGAAVASAATGVPSWHIVAPLGFVPVLFASWALRPSGRTFRAVVDAVANSHQSSREDRLAPAGTTARA